MTEQRQTRWLEAFVRESGIRSSLIVHGNVQDLCRDQETLDYEPIRQVMIRSLRRRGFDDVAVWDRVDGVQNLSPQSLEDLRRQAVEQAGTREL
ncbi:MAG: hypothetical protein FJY85_11580, partial [Deltaproteobacteria bacterium]|nr:hypothetical protein [Deltaproteobacteria bacterium]